MKKYEIITLFRHEMSENISTKAAEEAYDCIIGLLKKSIINDGSLVIHHFGSFRVEDRKERKARDPRTGNTVLVPPKRVLKFRPSNSIKEALNPNLPSSKIIAYAEEEDDDVDDAMYA